MLNPNGGMVDIFLETEQVEEVDLDRAQIEATTDIDELNRLFVQCDEFSEMLKAQAWAMRECGASDTDRFHRLTKKIGYQRMAMRVIEKRILRLGGTPEYSPADPRALHITRLIEQQKKARALVESLGGSWEDTYV